MRTIYYITKMPPDLQRFGKELKESIIILPLLEIKTLLDCAVLEKFFFVRFFDFYFKKRHFCAKEKFRILA